MRFEVAGQRTDRERPLLFHHLVDALLHLLVELVQVSCRREVWIHVHRAVTRLHAGRMQAIRLLERRATRDVRRRVARLARRVHIRLVLFIEFAFHACELRAA